MAPAMDAGQAPSTLDDCPTERLVAATAAPSDAYNFATARHEQAPMANHVWQSFIERIAWEGTVHVACDALPAPLDSARLARLDELNAGVLAALGMLGERSGSEPAGEDANAATLSRLDAKLDVLLEMFNRHLSESVQMPPCRPVRFNMLGILIEHWQPAAPDAAVLVRMYFDACVGLPLEMPGRVEPAAHAHDGGFVVFDTPAPAIRDGIEHLVFRQHRRQLAEARRELQVPRR